MYLTNQIVVGLWDEQENIDPENFFKKYPVKIFRWLPGRTFILKTKSNNPLDSLAVARNLIEDNVVRYAEPNLYRKLQKR